MEREFQKYTIRGSVGPSDGDAIMGQASQVPTGRTVYISRAGGVVPGIRSIRRAEDGGSKVDEDSRVLIGDPSFDDRLVIVGEPAVVLAALGHAARANVVAAFVEDFPWTVSLKEDELIAHSHASQSWTVMERKAHHLVRLVRPWHLAPEEVPRRLQRHVLNDPVAGTRLACLRALQAAYPDHPATRAASRASLVAAEPALRLQAAKFLDLAGAGVLAELADAPGIDTGIRVEALAALASQSPDPAAPRPALPLLLERLLTVQSPPDLLAAAIGETERLGLRAQLPTLVTLGEQGQPAIRQAVARVLGTWKEPGAESLLLGWLHDEDSGTVLAAIAALGEAGSALAVDPLRSLVRGFPPGRRIDHAAEDAVRKIQLRLDGAEAGQLSLAVVEDRAGALSLPEQEGELSIAETPPRPPAPENERR